MADLSKSIDTLSLNEIMRVWPRTIRVFIDWHLQCIGCPIADFHKLADAADEHGYDREALRAALVEQLSGHDGATLAETLMQLGVPCAPILGVDEALRHPHTAHREMVVNIGEHYTGIASPIKLGRTPASYRLPPPTDQR